ncbi:5-formyltetrahydrofolate cyclo-ligase [Paracoccus sp. p4-l81]|uniref:5-formyltetrahydrofolate cyclo-ligase n=1 Tax=Paracoccus sp. p4-l81 TaxID=3342806 RepID=UPI0035B6CC67
MKDALRKAMAARRAAAVDGDAQARAQAHLNGVLAAHHGAVLAGYMPMRSEIDPLPAMAAHHGAGGTVGVPVILARATPLVFHRWTPDAAMIPGTFGAQVPQAGVPVQPQVLIVPLLAFDARGFRLGYGGGFYDRTLAGLRARGPVTAIGFAWGAQQVDQVPTEPTDEVLDLIVTEAGIIRPNP